MKALSFAALAVALLPALALGQTRSSTVPTPAPDPTVVRTFTTTAGAHYFNGTQLVTCRALRDCSVQSFTAKDVVPLGVDATRLLVLDDSFGMRTCRLDLSDCRPIAVAGFPGAVQLTASGQVRL